MPHGSGCDPLVRGARLQKLSELTLGMLLIADTDLYGGCTNVVIVEQIRLEDHAPDDIGSSGFYGHFVKPGDPTQRRLASDHRFFVHWPPLGGDEHDRYYHVESP